MSNDEEMNNMEVQEHDFQDEMDDLHEDDDLMPTSIVEVDEDLNLKHLVNATDEEGEDEQDD